MIMCGARAPMLIAVGMYLPFDTSSAIFVGGLMKWLVDRTVADRSDQDKQRAEEKGTLVASGLIAGEAIIGILLAVTFLAGIPSLTKVLTGVEEFSWFAKAGGWLSLVAFLSIGYALVRVPTRR